ncbi:rifin [Plasmodium falciparum NF54]|uniref:Rifin n=2 Tax=Plasmodium falciparum TaxID=5833 RepID=O96116_PLAF7|nr:rifin [Plasmodium falciparum 3D7]KAF4331458.1 rifin [Plasmodium falciparum NF54]PKC46333.1 rifin [Plasmodium falciparum NF54]CZT98022.1 rifin [Plasmodium falciparum 3D7]|eukprot:XP_001349524.1 rifin [Plasmodium falciparum 3D7]
MKLNYTKILLFFFPLNILANNNKNKPSITQRHTPRYTSRVLSECDIRSSIYDNDAEMKSVKETFDRQTSQRFEEYEERMKGKRQKRKEQRDKNIQEIIEKDRMDKSLAEKVEKVCLRCGFGLGGVAAGVGIFGAIAVNEWTKAALVAAAQKGIDAGIKSALKGLEKIYELSDFSYLKWSAMVTPTTYDQPMDLIAIVTKAYNMCDDVEAAKGSLFCQAMEGIANEPDGCPVKTFSQMAVDAAEAAGKVSKTTEEAGIALANNTSYNSYIAIAYSVTAILIIVLIMLIIYLILRYRRKKKMNKKLQYTKLLNQ